MQLALDNEFSTIQIMPRLAKFRFIVSDALRAKKRLVHSSGFDGEIKVVEHIETGTFVRLHKRKLDIVTVPCFERKHAPQLAFPEPTEPKPIPKPRPKISLWQPSNPSFRLKA